MRDHDTVVMVDNKFAYRELNIYKGENKNGEFIDVELSKINAEGSSVMNTGISNDIDADGKKTLDVLLKYLAHIGEDPIYGTPFYWMVYIISREVATLVATGWYKYHISVR